MFFSLSFKGRNLQSTLIFPEEGWVVVVIVFIGETSDWNSLGIGIKFILALGTALFLSCISSFFSALFELYWSSAFYQLVKRKYYKILWNSIFFGLFIWDFSSWYKIFRRSSLEIFLDIVIIVILIIIKNLPFEINF